MIRAPQLEPRRRQDDACLTRHVSRGRGGVTITVAADTLTFVDLIWIEKRLQRWIRFGGVASERANDAGRPCSRKLTPAWLKVILACTRSGFAPGTRRIPVNTCIASDEVFAPLKYPGA